MPPKKKVGDDDAIPMLSVGGSEVMKVSVQDNAVKIDWMDPTWEAWSDLQDAQEYKDLLVMSNTQEQVLRNLP